MKLSVYKSYDDLPLFLNAKMVAQVLGVSISTAYELLNDPGFPTLRVGSRMVVPKEKFIQWAEGQSGGTKLENSTGPSGTLSRTTSPSPTRSSPWDCLLGRLQSTDFSSTVRTGRPISAWPATGSSERLWG